MTKLLHYIYKPTCEAEIPCEEENLSWGANLSSEETHGVAESPYEEGNLSCTRDINTFFFCKYEACSNGAAKLFF